MHLWRAGEIITADKLTPRILSGAEYMDFPTPVPSATNPQYYRGERRVTFPNGFFTVEPQVLTTARTNAPGVFLEVSYQSKSLTGFTIHVARQTVTQTWVDWVAIQVPDL
ncbi:hypothetical protein ACIRPH_29915 [Nocardiopsis sp. NPDC101807]|uniref:hypothetical protein n=1 Tax=Nocardiopsis sp. NPDC101807 TaxID=3364339 RepID=UPI0038050539